MRPLFDSLDEYLKKLAAEDKDKFRAVSLRLVNVLEHEQTFRRSRDVSAAILNVLKVQDHNGKPTLPPGFSVPEQPIATRQMPSCDDDSVQPSDLIAELQEVLIRNRAIGFPVESLDDAVQVGLKDDSQRAGSLNAKQNEDSGGSCK